MTVKIDPLTLTIVNGIFLSTINEMTSVLQRTTRGPLLKITRDFSNAILDSTPNLLYQGEDLPVHLGSPVLSVPYIQKQFEGDLFSGDVIYHNDPETGGTHLADMCMYKPIFYEDELMFWVVNRSHCADIGGSAPGSINPLAKEIFEEGVIYPGVKLYRKGVEDKRITGFILANMRSGHARFHSGDLKAAYGALMIAEAKLTGLLRKYGKTTVKACVQELLERSEGMMKAEIARWPKGEYEGHAVIEEPRLGIDDIAISCYVTIRDSNIHLSFKSPAQVECYVNAYQGIVVAALYYGILCYVDPSTPHNAGSYRPITWDLGPKGTVLNPVKPAPCSNSPVASFDAIRDCVCSALSKVIPERAAAGWSKGLSLTFDGVDPRRRIDYVYMAMEPLMGGMGAVSGADGYNSLGTSGGGGGIACGDVEILEYDWPLHIHRYMLLRDSACAGKWRGGFGVQYEVEPVSHDAKVVVWGEGTKYPPPSFLQRYSKFNEKKVYKFILKPYGEKKELEISKSSVIYVKSGDRIVCFSHGGGGVGDPVQRDPELVRSDVLNELVTTEVAREEYGVIIGEDLQIDYASTKICREKMSKTY